MAAPSVDRQRLLVGCAIKYLPGTGGHQPADGFKFGGGPADPNRAPRYCAGRSGHSCPRGGARSGSAAHRHRRWSRRAGRAVGQDAMPPPTTTIVMATAGSFAAISTLVRLTASRRLPAHGSVGSRWAASGAGVGPGPAVRRHRIPHLLGLEHLDRVRTFSLAIPNLPTFSTPDVAEFGWALVIGPRGGSSRVWRSPAGPFPAVAGTKRMLLISTPLAGAIVALIAMGFEGLTGRGSSTVLFSGQSALAPLVSTQPVGPGRPSSCCSCAKGWPTGLR